MPLFVATHHIAPHMSLDEAAKLVYGVLQLLRPDTTWQRYWLCDDEGVMFCLWQAPSADTVWDILKQAGVPTDAVYQVEEGDPSLLMQGLGQ